MKSDPAQRIRKDAWKSVPEVVDDPKDQWFAIPEPDCPQDRVETIQKAQMVASALLTLSFREERVLRLRYGIGVEEHTYEEIGHLMEISRERVRQIEAKALRKLKHPMRNVPLRRCHGSDVDPRSIDVPLSNASRIRINRLHPMEPRAIPMICLSAIDMGPIASEGHSTKPRPASTIELPIIPPRRPGPIRMLPEPVWDVPNQV